MNAEVMYGLSVAGSQILTDATWDDVLRKVADRRNRGRDMRYLHAWNAGRSDINDNGLSEEEEEEFLRVLSGEQNPPCDGDHVWLYDGEGDHGIAYKCETCGLVKEGKR